MKSRNTFRDLAGQKFDVQNLSYIFIFPPLSRRGTLIIIETVWSTVLLFDRDAYFCRQLFRLFVAGWLDIVRCDWKQLSRCVLFSICVSASSVVAHQTPRVCVWFLFFEIFITLLLFIYSIYIMYNSSIRSAWYLFRSDDHFQFFLYFYFHLYWIDTLLC